MSMKTALVCRTCLAERVDLLPLFPSPSHAVRAIQQRDLYRATGLTIEINDGLPQAICGTCIDLVKSSILLRDQSLSAEQKLLSLREKHKINETVDQVLLNSLVNLKSAHYVDTVNNFDNTSYMEEDKCMKLKLKLKPAYTHNVNMKLDPTISLDTAHVRDQHGLYQEKNKIKFYGIKTCSSKEETSQILPPLMKKESADQKSLKLTEKIKKCEQYSEGQLNVDGPIRCKVCKRLCNSLSSFSIHLRIHIGFNHICEFCGKKFYAAIGLKRHCMSWHGLAKELSCAHCHYRATSASRLREHERTHTGERPYQCDECGQQFHSRSSIVQHLGLHGDRKTVQCDKCPTMFKNRRALTTHVNQTHVRDYLYLCYLCDKRYSKNTSARKHLVRFHAVPREQQGKIPRFSLSKAAVVN